MSFLPSRVNRSPTSPRVPEEPLAEPVLGNKLSHRSVPWLHKLSHRSVPWLHKLSHRSVPWLHKLSHRSVPWFHKLSHRSVPWFHKLSHRSVPWLHKLSHRSVPWLHKLLTGKTRYVDWVPGFTKGGCINLMLSQNFLKLYKNEGDCM